MRSIAFMAEKGGVGKTTCAVNIAVALAKSGRRVLFIDVDPQANASMVLGAGQGGDGPTLFNVLADDDPASSAIRPTTTPGLDLLPSDGQLADANIVLASEMGRERRLRLAMKGADDGYDFVILDTSPQRSLLTVNAMSFAKEIIAPVDPGVFSLAGLGPLQEAIAGVAKFLDNPGLKLAGLIVSRAQRDNLTRDTEGQLREAFGPLVFKTVVPSSAKIGEAHARGQSVIDYAPGSTGAKAFLALTAEISSDGQNDRVGGGADGTPQANRGRRRRAG